MPLSKEGKILIKSVQECKGHNAWQFITQFLNKGWTKNSINRLLVKFGTVDRSPGSGRPRAHTNQNVDTVESLLLSQKDKPQNHQTVREIARDKGDPSIISFADYSQRSAPQVCYKKRRAQQLTEAHSIHALFSVCMFERR